MAKEMAERARIGRSRGDVVFDAILFIILTLLFIIVAYPLYFIIISSVSDPVAVSSGQVTLYPVGFSLEGYQEVFKNSSVVTGFVNSIFYAVLGVCINLLLTLPTAYALSRSDFGGRKIVMFFYMFTIFVRGGMMPTFLVVKNLGLLDRVWSIVLPGAVGVYNMIVARTFFKNTLSSELLDAATIDGCGDTRFFVSIALPLSSAIIAIMVLYYGIGHWNAYFSALLYISTPAKYPLQLVLRSILVSNEMQLSQSSVPARMMAELEKTRQRIELMKYSLIIISSIPAIVIYPFIQKHFVKGVMIGSVKG